MAQGPFFQHSEINIPDNLDDFPEDDYQELLALAGEFEGRNHCDKCDGNSPREKKLLLKLKTLQSTKKLLQKLNKDQVIELCHSRKLLQEALQENMKHQMTTPADTIQQTNNIQDEESMDVEGGNPCTY